MYRPRAATCGPHYAALQTRISTLAPANWPTGSGCSSARSCCRASPSPSTAADSATERIIPTDLLPRIIPADGVGQDRGGPDPAPAGAEHVPGRHLRRAADPDGRRGAARAGAGRAVLPPRDAEPLRAAQGLRQCLRLRPDPPARTARSRCWRTICGCPPACPTCWPTARPRAGPSRAPSARPACGRSTAIPTCCWRRLKSMARRLAPQSAGRGADARRLQLGLLRARLPGAPDGRAAGRGPRPRGPRQHGLHAHHHRPAPDRRDLPPGGRRLHRSPHLPPGFGAGRRRACSTPTAPATW